MRASQYKRKTWTNRRAIVNRSRAIKRKRLPATRLYRQNRILSNRAYGRVEVKSVDFPLGASSVSMALSTTAVFILMNETVTGAGFFNRIGSKISMQNVYVNGFIVLSSSNSGVVPEDYLRVMIVYDKQANGAAPALTDVLANYDYNGATTTSALSGMNMNNRDRFLMLADERIYLPSVGVDGVNAGFTTLTPDPNKSDTYILKRFIKLRNLEGLYKASGGGIGDIATGALWLITVTQNVAVGQTAWTLVVNGRLKFYD